MRKKSPKSFFALLGSVLAKALSKMLVKSTSKLNMWKKKKKKTFKEEIAHLDYCFIKIRHVDLRDKKKEKQTKKAPEEARRWR